MKKNRAQISSKGRRKEGVFSLDRGRRTNTPGYGDGDKRKRDVRDRGFFERRKLHVGGGGETRERKLQHTHEHFNLDEEESITMMGQESRRERHRAELA